MGSAFFRTAMSLHTTATRAGIRLQTLVVAVGVVLMAIKGIAWWTTDSNAILSDALESLVNVAAGAFALYSLARAIRPRDSKHPYGHGKIEFISASLEGALVVLAGLLIAWRAVEAFLTGNTVHELAAGIVLTTVAGVVNMAMGLALRRHGRRTHSLTMEAGGTHLMSDAWSTVAMLGGLVLISITGLQWIDAVLAFAFGAFITYQGARVLQSAVVGIMDATDDDVADELGRILAANAGSAHVDPAHLRVIKYGHTLHVDCLITLPAHFRVAQVEAEMEALECAVTDGMGRPVEVFFRLAPQPPVPVEPRPLRRLHRRPEPVVMP